MFFSSGQRCLTCQHAYVGLSAVCTVCPLPLAAPLSCCNNSKQQKVASRKLVRNKMQKGHRKPRSLRRPQKRSLRFDRAPALETITEKRKWNRAAKVEVVQTAAKRGSVERGSGTGVGNVTGNGQQSFNINAIYSSNFAFYVRAQYLTRTHTVMHAYVCVEQRKVVQEVAE